MRLATKKAAALLCAAAFIGLSAPVMARSAHHPRHHHHHRYVHSHHFHLRAADRTFQRTHVRRRLRRTVASAPAPSLFGGLTGNTLVADARRYIGTNPTGRRSLWCGAFMDKILRDAGLPGGGNLALGYLHYGRRVSGPQIGAIAVMGRRRGGHVGVVSGIDPKGNPIIVSGNHNRTVAESVYPRSRIIAYVMPN